MSENVIQIYNDSVLKMTIKQGDEIYRFNKGSIDAKGNVSSGNFNVLDIDGNITTQTNAFNSGELIYSRDTNRVFVGNFSPKLAEKQQQTVGGVLVGNKYLGYVDSKPDITTDKISSGDPLKLSGTGGLLEVNSPYRAHDWLDENNKCIATRDGHWKRESFYNSKYDAYDGDYAYDIYRNALILFDSRIKPNSLDSNKPGLTSSATGGKRKTILQPWECEKITDADTEEFRKSVKNYTSDMYGDGYVLLYNVIPDGETITFMEKTFNGLHSDHEEEDYGKTNGLPEGTPNNSTKKPFNSSENYSYNVLRIGKIRYESIEHIFKADYFIKSTDYIVPRMTHLLYGESKGIGTNTTYKALRDIYYTAVLIGTGPEAKATVNINGTIVFQETLSAGQKITINYPLIKDSTIKITNCTVSSSRYIPYKDA